jgi:putative membrane protein
MRFSRDDSDLVNDAMARAERGIAVIVAPRSDAYHDVGLHYAVLFMLLVPLWWMVAPQGVVDWFIGLLLGPGSAPTRYQLMLYLFAKLAGTFLVVRYLLAWRPLRMRLTPARTKSRRVRRRAAELFQAATRGSGALIYLSLDEKKAEIIADGVAPEVRDEAIAALNDEVKAGRPGQGLARAVERIGAALPPPDDRGAAASSRVILL